MFYEEKVNRLKPIVNHSNISKVAGVFKVLADETRAKIAHALCEENELCVCDVANIVGCTMATASHHLRLLILKLQQQGKTVMLLGTEREVLCLIAVADQVRESSLAVIRKLHHVGIKKTIMLTVDNHAIAEAIGKQIGIDDADVALMGDDINKLPYTIQLSRKTLQIIKQNISFSLAIKLVAILLVIPGWLTLWIAIFADMGATLIVILNSLRLIKIKE